MKRTGKPTFFVVAFLILALAFTAFFGISYYYGDNQTIIIKGAGDIRWGIDISGGVEAVFAPSSDVDKSTVTREQMDDAEVIIKRRLIGQNITDSEVYTDYNEKQITVRFPWKSDESNFDPNRAIEELGATAALEFRGGTTQDGELVLEGKDIVRADAVTAQNSSGTYEPQVALTLSSDGTQKFADATSRYLNQQISIWLDGEMISAPTVNTVISNGECSITNMTQEEAESLANQLNAGALPFSLEADDSRIKIISPTLGEQALDIMLLAGVIAFALVFLFVLLYYRLPGFIAVIALIGHLGLTFACISGYFPIIPSFTLTIPGLAGVILSIGMGVDANIITAERIKDELRLGKSLDGAIQTGYKNAFSAILDGNVTVIIVALVLMGAFGPTDSFLSWLLTPFLFMFRSTISGSIYSFGYTLIVGVVCNFIMGVTCSRLMLRSITRFKGLRKTKYFGVKPEEKAGEAKA